MNAVRKPEVVVITGAGAGLGRAIVQQFARRGARIGLVSRGRDRLEDARREVESLGRCALLFSQGITEPLHCICFALFWSRVFGFCLRCFLPPRLLLDCLLSLKLIAKNKALVDEGIASLTQAIELKPDFDDAMQYLQLTYLVVTRTFSAATRRVSALTSN